MSYRVHLRPEAEMDIEEAATWYEMQGEGLGDEFLDEVQSGCETIVVFAVMHGSRHPKQ